MASLASSKPISRPIPAKAISSGVKASALWRATFKQAGFGPDILTVL